MPDVWWEWLEDGRRVGFAITLLGRGEVSRLQPTSKGLVEVRGGLIPSPTQLSIDPDEITAWEQVSPRPIGNADWLRFQGYMEEIFGTFGMPLGTPGTERTPERFLKALYDDCRLRGRPEVDDRVSD